MELRPDGTVPAKEIDGHLFHTYPLNVMDGAEFELRVLLHLAPLVQGFEDLDINTITEMDLDKMDEIEIGKKILQLIDPVTFVSRGISGIDKTEFRKETMAIVKYACGRCFIKSPNMREAEPVDPDIHFVKNKILIYSVTAYFIRSQLGPFGSVIRRLLASRAQDGSQKEGEKST